MNNISFGDVHPAVSKCICLPHYIRSPSTDGMLYLTIVDITRRSFSEQCPSLYTPPLTVCCPQHVSEPLRALSEPVQSGPEVDQCRRPVAQVPLRGVPKPAPNQHLLVRRHHGEWSVRGRRRLASWFSGYHGIHKLSVIGPYRAIWLTIIA